jgi:surfactin synthase thioesterase subunit
VELALRGVAPYIEQWALTDPERVQQVAPALRWLTHNTRLGGEAQAWNQYLQARLRPAAERPVLDLPGRAALEENPAPERLELP